MSTRGGNLSVTARIADSPLIWTGIYDGVEGTPPDTFGQPVTFFLRELNPLPAVPAFEPGTPTQRSMRVGLTGGYCGVQADMPGPGIMRFVGHWTVNAISIDVVGVR